MHYEKTDLARVDLSLEELSYLALVLGRIAEEPPLNGSLYGKLTEKMKSFGIVYMPLLTGHAINLGDVGIWSEHIDTFFTNTWANKLPEKGRMCWVSSESPDIRDCVALIDRYLPSAVYPYQGKYKNYRFATPLTLEELTEMLG